MKYNLSANGSTLESYENVAIYAKAIFQGQVENKIADSEATELICENLLEFHEIEKYEPIVQVLARKARKDCKIVLSVINGRRLAEKLYYSEHDSVAGNLAIFGEKHCIKSMIFDQYDFLEMLGKYGIQVVQIRIEGHRDILVCKKQ